MKSLQEAVTFEVAYSTATTMNGDKNFAKKEMPFKFMRRGSR